MLDESEEACFQHLTHLDVEEFEDIKSGYQITFYFEENPYFENSVLTKEFQLGNTPTSLSIPIRWKEGMNLTLVNEPALAGKGRKRQLEHISFFSWYNDHSDPMADTVAEHIKDDLWLNPLQYFLVPDVEVGNGIYDEDGEDVSGDEDCRAGSSDTAIEGDIEAPTQGKFNYLSKCFGTDR